MSTPNQTPIIVKIKEVFASIQPGESVWLTEEDLKGWSMVSTPATYFSVMLVKKASIRTLSDGGIIITKL